jgi:hypothetical protein
MQSIVVPTPTAEPCTAAISTFSAVEIARRNRKPGLSMPVGGSATKSFRSLPAQNASPAPLKRTALIVSSASASTMASVMASYMDRVMALRLPARSRRMCTAQPIRLTVISCGIGLLTQKPSFPAESR